MTPSRPRHKVIELPPEVIAAMPKRSPGLGDLAASALAAVGITKERVEAIVGGPCGCDERQETLNEIGRKWLGIGNPPATEAKDGEASG